MIRRLLLALACLLTALPAAGAWAGSVAPAASAAAPAASAAAPAASAAQAPLRVGIMAFEPFVFLHGDGPPSGFSVELWEAIAADLGVQFEWAPAASIPDLIDAVQHGRTDLAIAGISLTPQREELVDFSHPYFASGLQILVRSDPEPTRGGVLQMFLASTSFKLLLLGLAALIVMAHLIWLFEARTNPNMPKSYFAGVWDGIWYGLRMLLKQEYMDTSIPARPLQRVFVMFYMVFGVVLIAEFTAAITTSQTVSRLRPHIESLDDLQGRRVQTLAGSTAEAFLQTREVRHTTVERIDDAYTALLNDETDAVVFDSPALLFFAQNQGYGVVQVVGPIFQDEDYAIALPTGSPLRKSINLALLRLQSSGRYDRIYEKWFGAVPE